MICFTVAEKLDRELFTTSILFTFFQTFPGRLERDVTMAIHIAISFANISYSAQAQVYDSLLGQVLKSNPREKPLDKSAIPLIAPNQLQPRLYQNIQNLDVLLIGSPEISNVSNALIGLQSQ